MSIIRRVRPAEDAESICHIYNHYIADTVVTFENDPLDPQTMQERIEQIDARFPYLVYEQQGEVLGYSYAATWRSRAAFGQTVETTIYLHPEWIGRGWGYELYQALVSRLQSSPFHVAVASITLPNTRSVALHEKLGFRKVAHFSEVGYKFDRWLDVGFWELLL